MVQFRKSGAAAAILTAVLFATPAAAEVTDSSDAGFITRDEAVVEASIKETWLALISPARWWSSEHTWSADAANLTLTPQAGGCFCEKIPEIDEPGRFTLEGSVEHMRVIQAYPESALRMVGALGPLQSEPVTGVLTIALSEVDAGTRIVWEYNVGGSMRYEIPVISKAVDGVMSQQLAGLAKLLGKVDVEPQSTPEEEETAEPEAARSQDDDAIIRIDPDVDFDGASPDALKEEETLPETASEPDEDRISVDEAFDDLGAETDPSDPDKPGSR